MSHTPNTCIQKDSPSVRAKDSLSSAYKRSCSSERRRRSDTTKPGKRDEEVGGRLAKILWKKNNDSFTPLDAMYPNQTAALYVQHKDEGGDDSTTLSSLCIDQ